MSRESTSQLAIPANGAAAVPYPSHREIVQGLLLHSPEIFIAEVTGAGGAGGSFVCPFEPAALIFSEVTGPTLQIQFPLAAGTVLGINMIDGTDAAADATYTAVDADDKTQGFTVAFATGLLPDADVASVICIGVRDAVSSNGSAASI